MAEPEGPERTDGRPTGDRTDVVPRTERRQSTRLKNLGRLDAEMLSDTSPVTLRDFGEGGFSVLSAVPFGVADIHRFRFSARHSDGVILRARVVYCNRYSRHRHGDEYVTGLAFASVDSRELEGVSRVIDLLTSALSFD